jgi:hypothetical protein
MATVELLPKKMLFRAQQQVPVPPEASQAIVSGTIRAARLSGELPFRLRQTFGLEKEMSLAAFHLMDLEAKFARGSC